MQKIELRAIAAPPARRLYWFLDGRMVASAELDAAAFLEPEPGHHTVRCVDDLGRADWVTFSVKALAN